ncbi:MAG: valine--tRNA ligase [Chlamydiia bacterium]|nr:valine--tRNA ligase [Chlamydiia bacterium]
MSETERKSFFLPKAYDAKQTESKWILFWENERFFKADASSSHPPYSIVIPPPNVTGVLHMGHALVNTLQDILIRRKRMLGFETLWIPGTDHAGIATQTVVERHLLRTTGKKRKDFKRDEFLEIVWKFKEKNEEVILKQLKTLGCSCDWSRLRFTMDDGCNRAVNVAFKKLFDKGLIYRGDYLVNWDPTSQTALADDEVEYEEKEGFLWYFKYPFVDKSGYAVVATTRPETMLGDVAVAVAPSDERYRKFIGKMIDHPLTGRQIPIIADHYVNPEFGTGMVKVTPAHDPNDYKIALSHNLEMINILTPHGHINENGGEFAHLSREEARHLIVKKLQSLGLLEKIVPHTLRVGVSYRSKAILEPYLSKQWFIDMKPFTKILKRAVEEGGVKIIPKSWENTYFHWINNLRDWCISRQLWWGHQIPVWYHKDHPETMICYDGKGLPPEVVAEPDVWKRDEDVLDTWFSSALWPLSTMGWPDKTPDFKKFYPTSVLVTGHDILFFWVARMILMDEYLSERFPFPETFLHGLIFGKSYWRKNQEGGITYITGEEKKEYDMGKSIPFDVESKWEKLSKSKGNVIDPLELIDEYGTDAVRMSLCSTANQSPQIDLDRRRFEEFKNFANKVWNGARFVFLNLEGLTSDELAKGLDESQLQLEDRWILSATNQINEKVNHALDHYSFDQAALSAYDFFWKEFCAYYLELAKPSLFGKRGNLTQKLNKQKLLVIVLCNSICLLHPMAPFITEELFFLLKSRFSDLDLQKDVDPYTIELAEALKHPACAVAPYPKVIREKDIHPEIEKMFSLMEEIVYAIRNIRGEMKVPPHMATAIYIVAPKNSLESLIATENSDFIRSLVKTNEVEITDRMPELSFSSTTMVKTLKIVVSLPEELREKELKRLAKEREYLIEQIRRLKVQLSNPQFLEKAKPELVSKQEEQLLHSLEKLKQLESVLG